MSGFTHLEAPLAPGAPVLVAGGGVTGRAVLAALTRLGAAPTLCDDDPATLRGFAETGVTTVTTSTAAQHVLDNPKLRAGGHQSGLLAGHAAAGRRSDRRGARLG